MKKIYFYRILKGCFLLGLMLLVYKGLDYIVVDDTEYSTRITFHDFYEMEDVDNLLIGPSHVFRGLDAEQLSNEVGEEFFCLSTSSQKMIGSYYVLKEALEEYDLKKVYLELSPAVMGEVNEPESTSTYIITDYLENFPNKVEYLLDRFSEDELVSAFSPLKRQYNVLESTDFLPWSNLGIKDENYYAYIPTEENFTGLTYLGRGSWGKIPDKNGNLFVQNTNTQFDNVSVDNIGGESAEYLEKIVTLCKENDIELSLFVMPFSELYLRKFTNYDEFSSWIENYAEENGINAFDLNLVKGEYLSLAVDDFFDPDHLNNNGNEKATSFLSRYIKNPSKEYFYETIDEKRKMEPLSPQIVTLEYEMQYFTEQGEQIYVPEKETDIVRFIVTPMVEGIEAIDYSVYYCYGQDEDKSVHGEDIAFTRLEGDVIAIDIPYINYTDSFAIEVFDKSTNESIYRVVVTEGW